MKKIRKVISGVRTASPAVTSNSSVSPLSSHSQHKMDDSSTDSFWHSSAVSQLKFNFDDDDPHASVNPLANLTFGAMEGTILQEVEPDNGHHVRSARRYPTSSSTSTTSSWSSLGLGGGSSTNTSTGNSTFYAAESSNNQTPTAQISVTEAAKLESEVVSLRRALEEATKDRWSPIPAEQTIRRIVTGKPYSVWDYKSKEHKLQLLDYALASHDGNAIMAAVLGAKKTLKQSLFYQELMNRPEALEHYLVHLKGEQEHAELSDILAMVDRNEEAALLNYRLALRSRLVRTRLDSLRHCLANHFQQGRSVEGADNRLFVDEHVRLLEMQRPVEDADARLTGDANQANKVRENALPARTSLLNASVITTLYYCCLHHYAATENELSSPLGVKRRHQLADKQFAWTAFVARAQCKSWKDIDGLVLAKSWLVNSKKFVIEPEKILEILHMDSADANLLSKFARMIENADERLEVATKFKCHEVAVDALVQTKDRLKLLSYGKNILSHTKEHLYWRDAVQSKTIKWKN